MLDLFNKHTYYVLGFNEEVKKDNIRFQTDGENLFIFNYTEKCQYEKNWNTFTLKARGMILDIYGNIVARPFDKFFNLEETDLDLDKMYKSYGSPIIEDKMDGSLGIMYYYYGKWNICTRGSFTSDQAIHATKLLNKIPQNELDLLDKDSTHLLEIIFPENKIVVNYGDRDELVYLWSRTNITGEYYKDALLNNKFGVKQHKEIDIKKEVKNAEGYVLYWPGIMSDIRVKIKFPEYIRLHRIMTGLTDKRIFECVRNGDEIDLTGVPEEFSKEVEKKIKELKDSFIYIDKKNR